MLQITTYSLILKDCQVRTKNLKDKNCPGQTYFFFVFRSKTFIHQ